MFGSTKKSNPETIEDLFASIANNPRTPILKLIIFYLLKYKPKPMGALNDFYIKDNPNYSLTVRRIIMQVQKIMYDPSLEGAQRRENILAHLFTGQYIPTDNLKLTTIIARNFGLFVQYELASRDNLQERADFQEIIKHYNSLEQANAQLLTDDSKLLQNLIAIFQRPESLINSKQDDSTDSALPNIAIEFLVNDKAEIIPLLLTTLAESYPYFREEIEIKLVNHLFSTIEYIIGSDLDPNSPKDPLIKNVLYILRYCPEIAKQLHTKIATNTDKNQFISQLIEHISNSSQDIYFAEFLLFPPNTPKDDIALLINKEFISTLCANNNNDNNCFTALLITKIGSQLLDKIFEFDPTLAKKLPAELLNSEYGNWNALALLCLRFYLGQNNLILALAEHNPALLHSITYATLRELPKKGLSALRYLAETTKGIALLEKIFTTNPNLIIELQTSDFFAKRHPKNKHLDGKTASAFHLLCRSETGISLLKLLFRRNTEALNNIDGIDQSLLGNIDKADLFDSAHLINGELIPSAFTCLLNNGKNGIRALTAILRYNPELCAYVDETHLSTAKRSELNQSTAGKKLLEVIEKNKTLSNAEIAQQDGQDTATPTPFLARNS